MPLTVTTDLARIDLGLVHRWLSTEAYWALGRSRETVQQAAENSLNFGALDDDSALCGYARVVTDRTTFAWLCDVIVPAAQRGRGIGKLLARSVVDTLEPMRLKRVLLFTSDAHGLYEQVGFTPLDRPEAAMMLSAAVAASASPASDQGTQA